MAALIATGTLEEEGDPHRIMMAFKNIEFQFYNEATFCPFELL